MAEIAPRASRGYAGVLVALALALAGVPAAHATVTVGSDLANAPDTAGFCSDRCTRLLIAPPNGLGASPVTGTIVRWRFLLGGGGAAQTVYPRVVRPVGTTMSGGVNYFGAFTGAGLPVAATAGVQQFAVTLPIRKGDLLGFDQVGSSQHLVVFRTATADWSEFGSGCDPLDDGETCEGSARTGYELMLNADVVAEPSSSAVIASCQEGSDISVTVNTDRGTAGNPGTTARAVHYRIDGGTEQAVLTTGAPGTASVSLPRGNHTLEYWGEDQLQQESAHHLAQTQIGGCTPADTVVPVVGADTPADTVAPVVSSVNVSPTTFRLGSLLATFSRTPSVGTTISFRLSEPATATVEFSQPKSGRKVARRCVRRTRGNKRKPHCTIHKVRGILSANAHAGINKVGFQGRLSRSKKLNPGRYTLTVTAIDAAGNRSKAKATSLTIARG
jgi:hypothetical protein